MIRAVTRSVARHTIIQIAGKLVGTLIALVTVSLMLRYLGRAGFGEYTTIMTYVSVFAIFGDLGLYLVTTREISSSSKARAEAFLSSALGLKLVASLVLMLAAIGLVWLVPTYSLEVKTGVIAGAASYLFIMGTQVLVGVFQKHLAMHKLAAAEVVSRLLWLGGVLLVIWQSWSLWWMLVLIAVSQAVQFFVLFGFAQSYYTLRPRIDWQSWKRILTVAAPLALSAVFNTIYFKVDTLILRWVDTAEAVGVYGAAYKVLENLVTFAAIFSGILLPLLVRGAKQNSAFFAEIYQKGLHVLTVLMLPLIVGVWFVAEPIVVLFGDVEFLESAVVLRVLIVAVAAIFFAHLIGNAVVALGKERSIMWLYLAVAVVALALYVIFIPRYSYMAAAVITVLAECTVVVTTAMIVWRERRVLPRVLPALKALVATLAMAGVLWLIGSWNFWLQIVVAVIVYGVVLLAVRGISVSFLREVVSWRGSKEEV